MRNGAASACEHQSSQCWPHYVRGVKKAFFGEEFSQPTARLNRQPTGSLFRPAKSGNSIHFAPPLTWASAWRKSKSDSVLCPITKAEIVIHIWNNNSGWIAPNNLWSTCGGSKETCRDYGLDLQAAGERRAIGELDEDLITFAVVLKDT